MKWAENLGLYSRLAQLLHPTPRNPQAGSLHQTVADYRRRSGKQKPEEFCRVAKHSIGEVDIAALGVRLAAAMP
jgi:hypothetical protein